MKINILDLFLNPTSPCQGAECDPLPPPLLRPPGQAGPGAACSPCQLLLSMHQRAALEL